MGSYYNTTYDNTLSEVSSLEPTIDTLAQNYDESRSGLDSVLKTVQFNESGTNLEAEMRLLLHASESKTRSSKRVMQRMPRA